jgi:hypothetical protein
MVKKMKIRGRATTSLYLIESRDAERKLREARNSRNNRNPTKSRAKKLLSG